MPGAVDKISIQPVSRKDAPSSCVHICTTDARLHSSNCGRLRFLNSLVPLPDTPGRSSNVNRASYVTAIVAEYSTQVQHHQFIFVQSLSRRSRMRISGAFPEGNYGFKGRTGCSAAPHLILNLGADFYFTNPGLKQLYGALEHFSRQSRSLAHL